LNMERRVSITRLKPECRERYLQAHSNVPEKVLARYRELGMRNCSVFLDGIDLVLVTEAENHAALDAALVNDPVDREWQDFVRPMKAEEDWRRMTQIYHVDL
jgi:L-rhamnose mutarotase